MLTLLVIICCFLAIGAFVAPLKSRSSGHATTLFAIEGIEPSSEIKQTSTSTSTFDAYFGDHVSKDDLKNLLSVCYDVQSSEKYPPVEWTNSCKLINEQQQQHEGGQTVVATKDARKGDVLTLLPVHAIGLRNARDGNMEYIEFNSDGDKLMYHDDTLNATRVKVPLNVHAKDTKFSRRDPASIVIGENPFLRMFILSIPGKDQLRGWLGGAIKTVSNEVDSNCIILPLPYASPFCAVVASKDIKEGDELLTPAYSTNWDLEDELKKIVEEAQDKGLTTLRNEVQKAFVGPFHPINLDYPGLRKIHSDPDIYEVDDFLTEEEMDRMITKAKPHLQQRLIYDEKNDCYAVSENLTYEEVNIPHFELPTIVNKFASLANCSIDQCGQASILHYEEGKKQHIRAHVDASRLTENEIFGVLRKRNNKHYCIWGVCFCYLNDVDDGGETFFPDIDLTVKPRRGTALIHFPTDVYGREDSRTLHQGSPATAEKWLYAITLWNNTDMIKQFEQSKTDPLSSDII